MEHQHLPITTDELLAVQRLVDAVNPSENDPAAGIALCHVDAGRRWLAWTGHAIAVTDTFAADGHVDQPLLVPRRLLSWAAAEAAHDHDVRISIDDLGWNARAGARDISFTHPDQRRVPDLESLVSPESAAASASAEVTAADLFALFDAGSTLPFGVDLDVVDAPTFWFIIDGEAPASAVWAMVDWSIAGAPAAEYAVYAEARGADHVAVPPAAAARLLAALEPDAEVSVAIPHHGARLEFRVDGLFAAVRSPQRPDAEEPATLPFEGTIHVAGSLRPDPLAGATLADVRAYAVDPDRTLRLAAAASRWNVDARVQRVLACDPDEEVVLALLDDVDPGVEAALTIIDGPHVAARRVLAGRNLPTDLLMRLADDGDLRTAELAACELARRSVRACAAGRAAAAEQVGDRTLEAATGRPAGSPVS